MHFLFLKSVIDQFDRSGFYGSFSRYDLILKDEKKTPQLYYLEAQTICSLVQLLTFIWQKC